MLSWRTARRTSGVFVTLALVSAVLLPTAAQAAGTDVTGGAPGAVAPPPADAKAAKVVTREIPTQSAPEVGKPHATPEPGDKNPPSADHVVGDLVQTDLRPFSMFGVTWKGGLPDDDTIVEARWRSKGTWSAWTELHVDPAPGEGGRPGTEPQWVDSADAAAVRVLSTSNARPQDLSLTLVDASTSTASATNSSSTPSGSIDVTPAATVDKPAIILRSAWGAAAADSCDDPRYGSTTRGAVIHHTAGSNSYTKSESAGIVKATQAYHMQGRDWCDIGYNFLVDKYGQIFEGRAGGIDKPVRAAHSGNDAVNQETMGVSMMGTFSSTEPSAAMKTAVVNLVSWRFAQYNLPAKGTYSLGGKTLNRIAGHRNVVSTECPGAKAYAWLSASGGLRDRVAGVLADGGTPPVTTVPSGLASTAKTPTSLTFSWNPVKDAPMYRIQLSTSSSMSNATYFRFTDPTGTITGLKANTKYYAKVRTIKTDGTNISNYSSAVSVTTPAVTGKTDVPKGLSSTAKTPTSLTFSWNPVTDAPMYRIQLSTSSSMSNATYYRFTDPTGTITGLKANTKYYAKVRTIETDGTNLSAYSSAINATTSASATSTGKKTDVPKGFAVIAKTSSSLSFAWNPVTNAPKYRIQLSTSSSMSNATYVRFTDPTGTITGLKANTKYYAKVRTIEADGTNLSVYSSAINSTTSSSSAVTAASVRTSTSTSSTSAAATTAANSTAKNVPASKEYTFRGHGYGHGIGMGQYGAEGGARAGAKYAKILSTYYPGTALGSKSGNIRVLISADTTNSVMVEGRSGLTLRYVSSNKTLALPTTVSGNKVVRWSIDPLSSDAKKSVLRYRTTGSWTTYKNTTWSGAAQFEASTLSLVMPAGADRTYRTALRSVQPSSGSSSRDTVNVLSVENYTRGVVAREMPASWHAEALKAQSVAARTYGVRSISSTRHYDICDTTSCQVYGGVSAETSATDSAVSGTAGKILTFDGKPALAQFSSSSGGYTSSGSAAYLKAINDPWDSWSGNANHSWTKTVKASTIQAKYPKIGTLKSLQVTKRSGQGDLGGRVTSLKIVGSKGTTTISGDTARFAFGLRSNWFAF
jgi:SpoIID/LytB domain protein